MCGVLTFCWTSAIRLPPPAVVLSLSTCLYQLVCINLSLWTCLYKFVSINLSLSTCLYQLVCINLSLSTCLHQLVSINLSLSICLYQLVSGRLGRRTSFARQARHLVTLSACLPLYPSLFPFVGWCVRLPGLPLSPIVPVLVSPCWVVCPPSRGDGVSAFPRSCLPLSSSIVSHLLVSLSWIACPPSRGLVSPGLPLAPIVLHSLPLSPHTCACVGRCVCLPEVLSPLVSLLVYPCLRLSPIVSTHDPPAARPAQRISGSADQRISGPADQQRSANHPSSGWADQRTSEPADQRISGPADQWISGSAQQLISGPGPADRRTRQRIRQPHDHKSLFPIVSHCLQLSPHLCAHVGWPTFPKSSRKSWNVNGRTWSQRRIMSCPTSSPVAPQVRKAKTAHRNTKPLILF